METWLSQFSKPLKAELLQLTKDWFFFFFFFPFLFKPQTVFKKNLTMNSLGTHT